MKEAVVQGHSGFVDIEMCMYPPLDPLGALVYKGFNWVVVVCVRQLCVKICLFGLTEMRFRASRIEKHSCLRIERSMVCV